jgi:hypothetical protein
VLVVEADVIVLTPIVDVSEVFAALVVVAAALDLVDATVVAPPREKVAYSNQESPVSIDSLTSFHSDSCTF